MKTTMTPNEIYELISAKSAVNKNSAKRIWNNFIDLIISELQNVGSIQFENFGKFEVVKKGGKDEWYIDEYGVKQKRYVDFYLGVEFIPSNNFIKYINSQKVREKWSHKRLAEEQDILEENARGYIKPKEDRMKMLITEDMKGKILELVAMRKRKLEKEPNKNKKDIKNLWNQKIKCLDNNKTYNSIRQCSIDLNLNYQNLNNRYHKYQKKEIDSFEFYGYNFEIIKSKKIGETE